MRVISVLAVSQLTEKNLFVNKLKLQVGLEYFLQIMLEIFKRKCIFSLYILTFFFFFHFGPYILILSLLVSKSISACHISPCRQLTNRKS